MKRKKKTRRGRIIEQMLSDAAVAAMAATTVHGGAAYNQRDTLIAYAYAKSAAHLAARIGPPWKTENGMPT